MRHEKIEMRPHSTVWYTCDFCNKTVSGETFCIVCSKDSCGCDKGKDTVRYDDYGNRHYAYYCSDCIEVGQDLLQGYDPDFDTQWNEELMNEWKRIIKKS